MSFRAIEKRKEIHMKSKKKFASIVATILAISCIFSSIPVEAGDAEIFDDENTEEQTNLALNCEYSGDYLDNIGSNYPDSGFKELTDGVIGSTTNFFDPAYVGIAGGRANLIVDFGYDQTFNSLTLHYIVEPSSSINPPKNVAVSYSKDKVNWTEFGTGGGVSSENECTINGEPGTGRFVKINIDWGAGWLFLSEVEIMGEWSPRDPRLPEITTELPNEVKRYEGDTLNLKMDYTIDKMGSEQEIIWTKDEVELPAFKNQKTLKIENAAVSDSGSYLVTVINRFDDGSEFSFGSAACPVTIVKSALSGNDPVVDTPDADSNNLAYGKEYWVSDSLLEEYEDIGQMTDGLYGSKEDYLDGRWLGFSKTKNATIEIVVDLGSSQSFQQVEARFLQDAVADSNWPVTAEIFTSDNRSTWKSLGAFSILQSSDTETALSNFYEKVTGTGQYVKFLFTPGKGDTLLVDEVRVLKTSNIPDRGEEEAPPQPDLSNNIAYGKLYEYNREPNTSYPDKSNRKLTDGLHGAGVKFYDPEWVGFLGAPEGKEDPEEVVVTLDLGKDEDFQEICIEYGYWDAPHIYLPETIKIKLSSDRENWQTLAEGSGAECTGTGSVRRFSYANAEGMTGRYVRFTTMPDRGWLFMDEIEVLKETNVIPDSCNIVRGQGYTVSRDPDHGLDGVLTDGRYGVTGTGRDKNWLGFSKSKNADKNHVELVFDLKGNHSLSKIEVYSREDAPLKLTTPKNLKFYVSNDGKKWSTLKSFPDNNTALMRLSDSVVMTWDSEYDTFISNKEGVKKPYTAYVKIAFDVPEDRNFLVYIDEVKIEGVFAETSDSGICLSDGIAPYNVAFQKPYTFTPAEPANNYPDDGVKMTDGYIAPYNFSDPGWVGADIYSTPTGSILDRWPIKQFVIDLEDVYAVNKITFYTCNGQFAAGNVAPTAVKTFASMDGENWMPLSLTVDCKNMPTAGLCNFGWHNEDTAEGLPTTLETKIPAIRQGIYELTLTPVGTTDSARLRFTVLKILPKKPES
ncbi:MAG: hypothetical protein DBY45_06015 [Clostridiales bacterium]|nr:MAG: hypothetical protein DBY45_06015 [Clostridiales bacterium]